VIYTGPAHRRQTRVPKLGVAAVVLIIVALAIVAVWPASNGTDELTADQRAMIERLESVLMHDSTDFQYGRILDQYDGRGYVAGRGDFSTAGGEALEVVVAYGAEVGHNPLAQHLPALRDLVAAGSSATAHLEGFPLAWRQASADPAFQRVQDAVMESRYFLPTIAKAAALGVRTPLGIAILYDTILQHGDGTGPDSFGKVLARTEAAAGTPKSGLDERTWLEAFLDARVAMLVAPGDEAHARFWPYTLGRVDALRQLLTDRRDSLLSPLTVKPYATTHVIDVRQAGDGYPPQAVPTAPGGRQTTPTAPVRTPATGPATTALALTRNVFFDDFSYSRTTDPGFSSLWGVRTGEGGPGQTGATWSAGAVTFSQMDAITAMTLTSSTDGTPNGTTHAEVFSKKKEFFAGTYAVRMRFSDSGSGAAAPLVNQSFVTISPLLHNSDPTYSEMDMVCLPDGGLGDPEKRLYVGTWYTYDASTGVGDSRHASIPRDCDGWHTLMMQVSGGTVSFFVDGVNVFSTTGKYYPRQSMSILFNQWFINGQIGVAGTAASFTQDIDWMYYIEDELMSTAAVQAQVNALSSAGTTSLDNVSG
jgi:Glycosyl hydrolase family 46